MIRIEHCENLIHFTKGQRNSLDYEEAYQNLKNIIKSRKIYGGTGMILGGFRSVCLR